MKNKFCLVPLLCVAITGCNNNSNSSPTDSISSLELYISSAQTAADEVTDAIADNSSASGLSMMQNRGMERAPGSQGITVSVVSLILCNQFLTLGLDLDQAQGRTGENGKRKTLIRRC